MTELQDCLAAELLGGQLGDGDHGAHTLGGELLRLGTDVPGGVIVEGRPFGFKEVPRDRDVRVIAAGRLSPGRVELRSYINRGADSREMRRRALALSFGEDGRNWRVELASIVQEDGQAVRCLTARAIEDVELPPPGGPSSRPEER